MFVRFEWDGKKDEVIVIATGHWNDLIDVIWIDERNGTGNQKKHFIRWSCELVILVSLVTGSSCLGIAHGICPCRKKSSLSIAAVELWSKTISILSPVESF